MSEQKQTLDQKRAAHAWEVATEIAKLSDKDKDEAKEKSDFAIQVKKLPTRILTAGLGQALAFLASKKKEKEFVPRLQNALADWIALRRTCKDGEDKRLFVRVIKSDTDFLRYATAECLAYLTWLVRWCDALGLKGDDQEAK